LDICSEGGFRFLTNYNKEPGIFVEVNPVQNTLKVNCICIERGTHTLTITDMLGATERLLEWEVSPDIQTEYHLEIPLLEYSNGIYNLIMSSPNKSYFDNFIITK